jgi:hypothetical protein
MWTFADVSFQQLNQVFGLNRQIRLILVKDVSGPCNLLLMLLPGAMQNHGCF